VLPNVKGSQLFWVALHPLAVCPFWGRSGFGMTDRCSPITDVACDSPNPVLEGMELAVQSKTAPEGPFASIRW